MSAPSRANVLGLYANLLRASRSFASYNFRTYFVRNTQAKFRANRNEADPQKIRQLYLEGKEELKVLQRSSIVNRLYQGPKLVIEKPRVITSGGGAGMEAASGSAGQPT